MKKNTNVKCFNTRYDINVLKMSHFTCLLFYVIQTHTDAGFDLRFRMWRPLWWFSSWLFLSVALLICNVIGSSTCVCFSAHVYQCHCTWTLQNNLRQFSRRLLGNCLSWSLTVIFLGKFKSLLKHTWHVVGQHCPIIQDFFSRICGDL